MTKKTGKKTAKKPAEKKPPAVYTHMLHSRSYKTFRDYLADFPTRVERRQRALVLSTREKLEDLPKGVFLHKTLEGDQFTFTTRWATSDPLADLDREYKNLPKRPNPSERSRALTRWDTTRTNIAVMEERLAKARADHSEACKSLIRTFGRGPLTLRDDETWDPSYRGEDVFYTRRGGGQ